MKTYLDPRDVELMEKCAASARDKLLVKQAWQEGTPFARNVVKRLVRLSAVKRNERGSGYCLLIKIP